MGIGSRDDAFVVHWAIRVIAVLLVVLTVGFVVRIVLDLLQGREAKKLMQIEDKKK